MRRRQLQVFLICISLALPSAAASYELHLPATATEAVPETVNWKIVDGNLQNWENSTSRNIFATVPDGTTFTLNGATQVDVHVYDRYSTHGVSAALCVIYPTSAGAACGSPRATTTTFQGYQTLSFTTSGEFSAWDGTPTGFGYIRVTLNNTNTAGLLQAGDNYRGADVIW